LIISVQSYKGTENCAFIYNQPDRFKKDLSVIPAETGIHGRNSKVDTGLRRYDVKRFFQMKSSD
jgi:hypothetical protein